MKLSKWNSYINLEGNEGLVYNAFTDRFIVVKAASMDLIHAQKGEIEQFSPLFREQMVVAGGMVEDDLDEAREVDKLILETDFDKSTLQVIVNPTLDCNFKCWYCYENHIQDSCMSEDTQAALITLIEKRLDNNKETKECQLSFFGGEPLLRFHEVVQPLISKSSLICKKRRVRLRLQFTTNAYLLDDVMIGFLRKFPASFQITLDGGRCEHDKTRFGKGGIPSYDVILKNIAKLAYADSHVVVRINYTAKNIESCKEIPNDLEQISSDKRNRIVVDFQRVWQDKPDSYGDTADLIVKNLRHELNEKGFRTSDNRMIDSVRNSCYADKYNELLVNYNGDVFFCTARDFIHEHRAGKLRPDGDVEWIDDRYKRRLSCKFRKPLCRECRIAPICGGGCRTKCLETAHHEGCNLRYSEEDIDNIVMDRFINRFMIQK